MMADIALLSGGLGQEINKRSEGASHPLWSVKVMFDRPDIVEDVHRDYIAAGAQVLTLNTYTATPQRMMRHGFGAQLAEAHEAAKRLVLSAIDGSGKSRADLQIAGCLPPLVASYVAEDRLDFEGSLAAYRQLIALQSDVADLFLLETMSNIEESCAGLEAIKEAAKPAFVGLTLSDSCNNTLRSGEPLEDALEALLPLHPDGIMINCSAPEAVTKAMPLLAQTGVAFGGYANGFTAIEAMRPGMTVDVLEARKDLGPEAYAAHAFEWIEQGATLIGGCCEVGPAHIQYLSDALIEAGHHITGLPYSSS